MIDGAPISLHPRTGPSRRAGFVLVLVAMALVLFSAAALSGGRYASSAPALVGVGLAAALVGALLFRRKSSRALALHREGVRFLRSGEVDRAFRFEDVERYRYERAQLVGGAAIRPELGELMRLRVWTRHGDSYLLSSAYARPQRIAAFVLPRLDKPIVARLEEALSRGEAVSLGEVRLRRERLERRRLVVPYAEVHKLTLRGAFLVVTYTEGNRVRSLRIKVFGVDNGSALVQLLGRLTPAKPISLLGHSVTLEA